MKPVCYQVNIIWGRPQGTVGGRGLGTVSVDRVNCKKTGLKHMGGAIYGGTLAATYSTSPTHAAFSITN